MKTKLWLIGWFSIVLIALAAIAVFVIRIDPFFHYHKPNTDTYYYTLERPRSQNDGITRYFDYDALITGTSMTENFKTSEIDKFFEVYSVKLPYSGGTYKEINDNIRVALETHTELKKVFRGLDTERFMDSPELMREDMGTYPAYLYDRNIFNDVYYWFNKDIIFSRAYDMERTRKNESFQPGITSFDAYSRWQEAYTFGINTIMPEGISFEGIGEPVHLSEEEKNMIYEQITLNVTSLADEYPETEFYYFFTPYSILWYKDLVESGEIYRQIEAEQYVIELILNHENIRLFSFNGDERIITDLNNYKDKIHYATWISSYMLRCMHENEFRLTKENYETYIENELSLFLDFDYMSLLSQEDYADDYYSEAVWNNL